MAAETTETAVPQRLAGGFAWRQGEHEVSTDPARLDLDFLVDQLATAYWARGRQRATIERSIAGSIPFGLYTGPVQVGFARVVSDRATFAYVCDVLIAPAERGRGLGTWLMACVAAHPDLQGLRRWLLATRDAHALYARSGFTPLHDPSRWMERLTEPASPPEDRP